ncbi:hypothetical protein [Flavobacterium cerinum]|uniref:Uncharacterized protein n=1 Tax=Flavobacterium cerinum TaxID=2502784 RepID=A0ABY5IU19_9FLAO|nr:hypothetical protein [Flavobacterium cerinum]UUC46333.1 hypothetical protein NOX80_03815 [Flavobacterium cerinum]
MGQAAGAMGTFRLAAGAIEISSGAVSAMVKLSGTKNEFALALQKHLLYLELVALSGEISIAIRNRLKSSAREVLEKHLDELEELKSAAKNADEAKEIDEIIEHLKSLSDDLYIPNKLIKQEIRFHKDVKYEISIYTKKIEWRFLDLERAKNQRMELDDYFFISFDFRIPDELLGKGFGKHFLEESFSAFKNQIKGAKASWTEFSIYPGGSSLGYKQFWKIYDQTGDPVKAVKETDFFKIVDKKGINKLNKNSISIDHETNSIDVIISK